MCRYGQYTYKDNFACFKCRKAFKKTSRWELPEEVRPAEGERRICKCPQCGEEMADMGLDFKAPKNSDVKQWRKVEILYQHDFTFHSCGCCGPGFRPKELNEVFDFIDGSKSKSEGEMLLQKIDKMIDLRETKSKSRRGHA